MTAPPIPPVDSEIVRIRAELLVARALLEVALSFPGVLTPQGKVAPLHSCGEACAPSCVFLPEGVP